MLQQRTRLIRPDFQPTPKGGEMSVLLDKYIEAHEKHPQMMSIAGKLINLTYKIMSLLVFLSIPLLFIYVFSFEKFLLEHLTDNKFAVWAVIAVTAVSGLLITRYLCRGKFATKYPLIALMSVAMGVITYWRETGQMVYAETWFVFPAFFALLILFSLIFRRAQENFMYLLWVLIADNPKERYLRYREVQNIRKR